MNVNEIIVGTLAVIALVLSVVLKCIPKRRRRNRHNRHNDEEKREEERNAEEEQKT